MEAKASVSVAPSCPEAEKLAELLMERDRILGERGYARDLLLGLNAEIAEHSKKLFYKLFREFDGGYFNAAAVPDFKLKESWFSQGLIVDRQEASGSNVPLRRHVRLEVPADVYYYCNFNARLIGPGGITLKLMEEFTGCKINLRGRYSIKDPDEEQKRMGKPGYEHLEGPLAILIDAEFPRDIVETKLTYAIGIIKELFEQVRSEFPRGENAQGTRAGSKPDHIRKILCVNIPDDIDRDKFIAWFLGHRATESKTFKRKTGCLICIRGKGSHKDAAQEEKLRGRSGYGHLEDPCHILVEAEGKINEVDEMLQRAQEKIPELFQRALAAETKTVG